MKCPHFFTERLFTGNLLCGFCEDCRANLLESVRSNKVKAVKALQAHPNNSAHVQLFGFEINQGNLDFIHKTLKAFSPTYGNTGDTIVEIPRSTCDWRGCVETPPDIHGFASFHIRRVAVDASIEGGTIWAEKCYPGQENCKIGRTTLHALVNYLHSFIYFIPSFYFFS